jgi:hypothetical protein
MGKTTSKFLPLTARKGIDSKMRLWAWLVGGGVIALIAAAIAYRQKRFALHAFPNVRERHTRALFINIPISKDIATSLVIDPIQPDFFRESYWLSIVIDDLDRLEAALGMGVFVSTFMNGWLMKVNLLVRGPGLVHDNNQETTDQSNTQYQVRTDAGTQVPAYQILTIDFQKNDGGCGLGRFVKELGAKVINSN